MRREASGSTGEKVLNAALGEFARHGYAGARVDRIARLAGVNKAMIYYHFRGKEALYEQVLTNTYRMILAHVTTGLEKGDNPLERLKSFIDHYVDLFNSIDNDILRIILREISSGGKYFRKIIVPNLIVPVIAMLEPLFMEARERKLVRDLNPHYTFIQVVGSIIFFNLIKIPMEGTPLQKLLFSGDYPGRFKKNLFAIIADGIELKEKKP